MIVPPAFDRVCRRVLRCAPLLLGLLLPCAKSPLGAQEQSPAGPRIALVLSSGGARALAQLGALEALEELRVPVDLVVGSECGALLGGLYAAGLSPAEIRALIDSEAWISALGGRIERRSLSWRQRTVERDFLVDLPVAFGPGRIGLRPGFSRTRWISWLLTSATLPVAGVPDFDRLPIAFRAASCDLRSGEQIVLQQGPLAAAILASLSTPGRYAPVEFGGRPLASGALLSPLPVQVALDCGAQIVLLVDVATTLDEPQRLESFLSAATQARLVASEVHRAQGLAGLREQDVCIRPDLAGLDEGDFRAVEEWSRRGREAVEAVAARLEPLALDPPAWEQHLAARRAKRPGWPQIRSIRFQDHSGLASEILEARVATRTGEQADPRTLSDDLLRLYGLDYHERIDVSFEASEAGGSELCFDAIEASNDLWVPRAGIAFEGVFGQDATFVGGGAFTLRPINALGAEWRNRLELGSSVLAYSEFWQPIDRTATWFVAPALGFQQRRTNLTVDEDVLATFDVTALAARLDLGRTLGNVGDARLGVVREHAETDLAIGDPALFDQDPVDVGYLEGRLQIDTLDSLGLPRQGSIARLNVTSPLDFLGGDQVSFLSAQFDQAHTWRRTTVVFGAEYDTALDDEDALASFFPLGGFLRLSGLGRDSIGGAHAGLVRAVSWVNLNGTDREPRTVDWYVGGSLEAGQTWLERDQIDFDSLRPSGSLFLAADTLIGPIILGVGWTSPGEFAGFLTFGKLFGNWDPF